MNGDEPSITWPLAIIDFEASSLGAGSYPIEVGVCLWRAPDEPVGGWSTLIRPTLDWEHNGEWNPVSAQIHKIDRAELETGMTPTETVVVLNALLEGVAWCDGGHEIGVAQVAARFHKRL